MPRKNLDRFWGESDAITVRLGTKEWRALGALRSAWGGTKSEVIRRAIREAAQQATSNSDAQTTENTSL